LFTHPYVATISIILPARARKSKKALDLFIARIDPETKLIFQRIRPWGTWAKSTVSIGDLHTVKSRFAHLENFATTKGSKSVFGFGQKFFVGSKEVEKQVRAPGIWRKVEHYICERSSRAVKKGR
jgi:hypothetical protein